MIMKKFEALEQVMAASKPPAGQPAAEGSAPSGATTEGGLTEEQLQELFVQTSTFRVRDTLATDGGFFFRDEADLQLEPDVEGEEEEDEYAPGRCYS